jgi:hypothetical protein
VRRRDLLWGVLVSAGCGRIGFAVPTADGQQGMPVDASRYATAMAYWSFDEGSGTLAHDQTGHGHTMSLVNSPMWVAGEAGSGVESTGTSEYLVSPVLDMSATAAVTVSIWSKRPCTSGPRHTLFELSTDMNGVTGGFGLFPDDNTTCVNGQIMLGLVGNVGQNFSCYAQPSSNVWHHIVVVYDKSQPASGESSLWIDDVPQPQLALPGGANNTNTFGAFQFFVLSRGGTQEFNAGVIDELAVWDHALTPTEIGSLP